LAALVAGTGSLLVTGSFVSGLMCWPEVDVMVHVGSGFSPPDVMSLLAWIVSRPGVTGLDYRDERGPRCVTGQVRDERYHVPLTVEHAGRSWQIDLTLWLHDPHLNVTRWHEELRARITAEERIAVLRIKDDWCRRPVGCQKSAYPVSCGDGQSQLYGIMTIHVLAPALPHLRPALQLAGPGRSFNRIQGCRAARAAT